MPIRDEHIDAAIAQGILSNDQAARLRALADDDAAPDPDDEKFRLIGGFNDVFVTIGVGLLVAALFALSSVLEFRIGFAALGMVAAWGLSEVFAQRMRLALPSIALAAMFAGSAAFAAMYLGSLVSTEQLVIAAGIGAALGAAAHWWRFRVPVDWAIAALGISFAVAHAILLVLPAFNTSLIFVVLGLAIFAVALRIDASDRERRTRRSDVAFWLHLVAAPMIVHGLIPLIIGSAEGMETVEALAVLAIFLLLGLVAVVIDRRALLVSGLTYAGIAMGYLISQGVTQDLGVSLTLLGLAAVVLGLSAGWRSLRRALLPLLPLGSLRHSVPPAA